MTSPSALESVVSEDYEAKGRTPVPSVCTVDTTVSDDISCSSFSVRSVQQQQPVRQTNSRASKGKGNATRGGKANSKANRGQKQQQQMQKATAKVNPTMTTTKSRAEALKAAKPANRTHAQATENATMKFDQFKKDNAQKRASGSGRSRATPTTSQPNGAGRGNTVRAGNNGVGQSKSHTQHPSTKKTNSVGSSKAPISAKKTNSAVALPGSPLGDAKKTSSKVSVNNDHASNRLPPVSPFSQSLFTCEIGASEWSLPSLPAIGQPKTTDPAKTLLTPPLTTTTSNSLLI